MLDTPQKVAWFRALLQALAGGALAFFVLLPQTDDWKIIVSGVGVAVFTPLAGRGAVEGRIDAGSAVQRAADREKAAPP